MNRKKGLTLLAILIITFIFAGVSTSQDSRKLSTLSTLKALAEQRGIRFGAMYQWDFRGGLYDRIFEKEMNVMTAGTFMLDGDVSHKSRAEFDFSEMDEKINWGLSRNMEVHGHTLVWFDDIADWVKASPLADVESIMNERIDAFVKRYAGKIKVWDVVNEAVNDGGSDLDDGATGTLRVRHKWAEAMGTDYIRKAFVRAHVADPNAVLRYNDYLYNDYFIENNKKKFEGIKALLIDLKKRGAPVHALGWQMHVTPTSFDAATFLAHLNEIADLGLDNYITELDVELPENPTAADYENQEQTYKKIVQTFLAARRHKTIVVWGLRDGDPHWLTENHPLLFNENLEKKPAYFGVQEALKASSVPKLSSKFDLWQKPSFFRGAAVHPYTPYGEEEGRIYITKQDLQALRKKGANAVSLNYPGPFGVSPPYGIDEEALKYLDDAIKWSGEVGLYAIIHFRNGPGKSEETFYGEEGREDELIWYSEEAKAKWVQMWQFVAQRYKDKPHIVGYNLMVEPHPEDATKQKPLPASSWINLAKRITGAIRKVDKDTPIIVGATVWSNPIAFADLKPTGDERTIYSFHMYEPYEFTHQGLEWAGKGEVSELTYPGIIPSDHFEEPKYWNKALIEEFLKPVLAFRDENKVPIFVGEFGCNRRIPSCATYLKDLLEIFETNSFGYTYYVWNIDDDFNYQKEVRGDERVGESQYMRLFKKYWGRNKFVNLFDRK